MCQSSPTFCATSPRTRRRRFRSQARLNTRITSCAAWPFVTATICFIRSIFRTISRHSRAETLHSAARRELASLLHDDASTVSHPRVRAALRDGYTITATDNGRDSRRIDPTDHAENSRNRRNRAAAFARNQGMGLLNIYLRFKILYGKDVSFSSKIRRRRRQHYDWRALFMNPSTFAPSLRTTKS